MRHLKRVVIAFNTTIANVQYNYSSSLLPCAILCFAIRGSPNLLVSINMFCNAVLFSTSNFSSCSPINPPTPNIKTCSHGSMNHKRKGAVSIHLPFIENHRHALRRRIFEGCCYLRLISGNRRTVFEYSCTPTPNNAPVVNQPIAFA